MKKNTLNLPTSGEIKLGGYAGDMIRYTIDAQLCDKETWKLFVNQFRITPDDEDLGWRGEYWGKMMRGAALTYRATKDEALYEAMRETVLDLLTTQDSLGRISTYSTDAEFQGWDMWSRKYIMLGLMYFLDVCKSKALERRIIAAMKRHANYIVKKIGKKRGQRDIFRTSNFWGCLNSCSILEPFVKLYNLTGEKRYFDFSTYLVESGFCEDMNLIELCLSKELYPYQFKHVKAYEMMSCFEGLLEYYKIVGNEEHLRAVEQFVDMVVETDYTIIGCSGCTHELFDNSTVMQTEPAREEIMQETCVTVTFMKLCAKLLVITGKAKYAALIEKSGLNALFGAVNNENQTMEKTQGCAWKDGVLYFPPHESFPFDSYSPLYYDKRGVRIGGFKLMQDGRSYGCCACIGSAGTAIMSLYTVMHAEDGLCVNMYNDCRFKTDALGERVTLAMFANPYSASGAKINVNGKGQTFTLSLRVPEWAEGFSVSVNGESLDGCASDGYLKITRAWGSDKVKVSFKAPMKLNVRNGKIAFTKGAITLARDERLEDIRVPVSLATVKDGKNMRAKEIKNTVFNSNAAYELTTKNGKITLVDYAQAGKNYDEDNCTITVWQDCIK